MRTWILLSTFALALPLAACGDDTGGAGGAGGGGDTSSDTTDAATTDAAATTTDAASTGTGTPSDVELIDCTGVTPDAEVTNEGSTAFSPASATVPVGGVVRFDPAGAPHNMTSDEAGVFATATSEEACLRFNAAGDFAFHCSVHPVMVGTITVE